jgi:signal transduction histidine kinase
VAAGAAFQAANIALMLPLMLFIKGPAFFGQWRKTLVLDLASETGVLGIGIAGAVLVAEEWWAALFLAVPVALAYLALASSVREAAENIKLARQVQRQMDELKATQEQLVQQEKMASIGTLAAGVAHEINNPLFAINAAAQVLLRQKGRHLASDRAAKYVESILNMADSASKITTDLLRFSRSKATPEPLSLPEVMDAALVLVSADLTFRGVTVKREYGPVPPVLAHRSQLQQVFVNLLMNARDAAPQNGTVTLRCHGENGHVVASVSDTGPGIPPDALPHIFEPFYTTKAVGKGTGLGLYICHKIVTEHNGQIRASSKAGEGTEMTVVLPSMAAEPARPAPVSSGERQNGAAAGVQSEPAPAETGPSGGRSYR